ncbi:MAG: carboxypeptidase-like regulatory domain-containing protein [Bacteroidetes bacterium]|nr:carboxypeptidase-like regulatory domain-containing protein [Bacteroidota bacterium]
MKYLLAFIYIFISCLTNLQSQTKYTSLYVFVTELDGVTPIANATIRIEQAGWASKTTGKEGIAYFDGSVPIGRIRYIVSKEGYSSEDAAFNVTTEEKSNTLRVKLNKRQDEKLLITGKVTDKYNKELSGANIEVKIADLVLTAKTDKSGNYAIELMLDRVKYNVSYIRIEAKCSNGNRKIIEEIAIPKTNNIPRDFKLDCDKDTTLVIKPDAGTGSINRWFGFGLLVEFGCGSLNKTKFLAVPYGAFLRAYMTNRFAFELQYHRSQFSIKEDLQYTATHEKFGQISATFAYQDVTALLNFTSIRSKKNRFRSYGGAKVSLRRYAEFEITGTQSSFVGSGELPTIPQFISVVFGCGYEFGGFGHKFPLITADVRCDFGTKNIMREFVIPETNTTISLGKVSCIGIQIGIGF